MDRKFYNMNFSTIFSKALLPLMLMAFLGNLDRSFAQDPLALPEVIHKSPEAASLGRYGDMEISEFTGTPNISIPLHTIKIGDIQVPISLSYNATGIRVDQEATIVGLGWDLLAGGGISYIPIGGDERLTHHHNYSAIFSWEEWQTLYDPYKGNYFLNTYPTADPYSLGFHKKYAEPHSLGNYVEDVVDPDVAYWCVLKNEGEQDMYSASFLGHNYKFFIHPNTGEAVFVGQKTKDKIRWIDDSNDFEITDANGTKYFFTSKEMLSTTNFINYWYLTRITNSRGNFVQFNYENFGYIYPIPSLSETAVYSDKDIGKTNKRTISAVHRAVQSLYLTSIETRAEQVIFEYDQDRKDLLGEGKRHLTAITIHNIHTDNLLKKYQFEYSYFNGCDIGGNYLDDGEIVADYHQYPEPNDDNLRSRLKLIGVDKVNPVNGNKEEKYFFTYNEKYKLPLKTSFSQDFWGLYNGRENKGEFIPDAEHTLIPDPKSYPFMDDHPLPTRLKGANRSMDPEYSKLGMLRTITYPTGGMTEFNFEPHISNSPYGGTAKGAESQFSTYQHTINDYNDDYEPSVSAPSKEFTLTEKTKVTIIPGFNKYEYSDEELWNSFIKLSREGESTPIAQYNIYDNPDLWVKEFELDPGTYVFECDLDDRIAFPGVLAMEHIVNAHITYTIKNQLPQELTLKYSGGLRIESITNYDDKSKVVSKKRFKYYSGIELNPVLFYLRTPIYYNDYTPPVVDQDGNTLSPGRIDYQTGMKQVFSSNNIMQRAPIASGANVGYSKVETEYVSENGNIGKEVSTYSNYYTYIIDERFFYIHNYLVAEGDLTKKEYFDENGDIVKMEKFTYEEIDVDKEFIHAYFTDRLYGYTDVNIVGSNLGSRYKIWTYANENYFHYLKRKETYNYLDGKEILSWSEYDYDPLNYQLDETRQLTSKGKIKKTTFKYPHDFDSGVSPSMVSDNILTPVIEQSSFLDNEALEYYKTEYQDVNYLSRTYYAPYEVFAKIGDGPLEKRVSYDKYDGWGNILQYHKENDIYTSFYWDYNHIYPVAKIEGIQYDDIPDNVKSSLQVIGSTEQTGESLKAFNNSIREGLQDNFVTTYTYNRGVGLKTMTGPNNRTSYYDYDDFNRLLSIKDDNSKILKAYEYQIDAGVRPPSGFNCTSIGTTQISLAWTEETDPERSFALYRYNGETWTEIYSGTANAFNDTGLELTTDYQYKLTVKENGKESFGVILNVRTKSPLRAPNEFTASVMGPRVIVLNWQAANTADGYHIYRSTTADGAYSLIGSRDGATSYPDESVEMNTQYWYKIKSYNASYESDISDALPITSWLLPPNIISAEPLSESEIQLTWEDHALEEGYKISMAGTELATVSANTTSYNVYGLSPNTLYSFRIEAVHGDMPGYYDYHSSIDSYTLFASPENLQASKQLAPDIAAISLSWDDVADEEGYRIYRAVEQDGDYTLLADVSANTTNYDDNSIEAGTTYYYKVNAYSGDSESNMTDFVSDMINVPGAFTLNIGEPNSSSIGLDWSDAGDEGGYRLYIGTSVDDINSLSSEISADQIDYWLSGLTPATEYFIRMEAVSPLGISESNTVSFTTSLQRPSLFVGTKDFCNPTFSSHFEVNPVDGAISYEWEAEPTSSFEYQSGQGTVGYNVAINDNGTIRVRAVNGSIFSDYLELNITVGDGSTAPPSPPGNIIVTRHTAAIITLSIAQVPGASSYTWTVPSDWTVRTGQGTYALSVEPVSAGNVTVTANNCSGSSAVWTQYINPDDY